MDIYYIERTTGEKKKEIVAGDRFLRWMYDTKSGNTILETIGKKKIFSTVYGKLQDFTFSRKKIKTFVRDLQIDMSEAERESVEDYSSFNDFFTRKLKKASRPLSLNKNHLISPADGRVFAYENIDKEQVIQVKGSYYRLGDLLDDEKLADEFNNGVCIVIRLCPADYHRFHFPDSGVADGFKRVNGQYYSVNPISLHKIAQVYCQNKREITLFDSDNFGKIIFCEVGATCVGSIVQTYKEGEHVEKGEEKGYFKFGGSTVILFLKNGQVKIDEAICQNTKMGIETKINMGEILGEK
ncbi:phosphatidylserine decarboxylase [Oceanirhabdus sp. W0125-5]|uniref:phosphatidylserine decarboxylase n=1 Tax=Oceanirhabdus sp. W0125-5 TaxID=2999116 RepID=UPI0022F339E0|nr:phosphatidylserine decarboxylase [Oceanirhabdus sp. W0125-5]WBW96535.1 phosphatidylserine decarboxylase [Oceanirhabdus sp. W0125-5]